MCAVHPSCVRAGLPAAKSTSWNSGARRAWPTRLRWVLAGRPGLGMQPAAGLLLRLVRAAAVPHCTALPAPSLPPRRCARTRPGPLPCPPSVWNPARWRAPTLCDAHALPTPAGHPPLWRPLAQQRVPRLQPPPLPGHRLFGGTARLCCGVDCGRRGCVHCFNMRCGCGCGVPACCCLGAYHPLLPTRLRGPNHNRQAAPN